MNKFVANLIEGVDLMTEDRAKALGESAKLAQENLINGIKNEIVNTKLKLMEYSNCSTIDGSNSVKTWVNKVQELKFELYGLKTNLELAEETYNEFFVEIKKNGK